MFDILDLLRNTIPNSQTLLITKTASQTFSLLIFSEKLEGEKPNTEERNIMDIIYEYEEDLIRYVADRLIETEQASSPHLEHRARECVLTYFSALHHGYSHMGEDARLLRMDYDDRMLRMSYVEKRFKIEHVMHIAYTGIVLPSGFISSLKTELNTRSKQVA